MNNSTNGRIARWHMLLVCYRYEVVYHKGKDNNADPLSRYTQEAAQESCVGDTDLMCCEELKMIKCQSCMVMSECKIQKHILLWRKPPTSVRQSVLFSHIRKKHSHIMYIQSLKIEMLTVKQGIVCSCVILIESAFF